jgi:hypothetical protein
MATKIDIHIYAVKSRKENVERMIKKLGEKNVTVHWDESDKPTPYERYYENCKGAWMAKRPKGLTHRVVLADDADVSKDFINIIQECAEAFPDNIFSFCSQHVAYDGKPYQIMCSKFPMGVVMMLPVKYIDEIFGSWTISPSHADDPRKWGLNTDETVVERFCVRRWGNKEGQMYLMTTHPNTAAHLGMEKSELDPTRGNGYSSASFDDNVTAERFKVREVGVTI